MLAATAVGGSFESARSAAAAIEHFQSGALIHDDIADNGQLRRGKPCMHLTEARGLPSTAATWHLPWSPRRFSTTPHSRQT